MKMISIDDLIKYCDNERAAYKANNCGAACTALRRVVEFAKEQAFEALDVVSNEKYVELKDGLKKIRSGNFVVYDINYLIENLAREITLLYQTSKDFSKAALNIDDIRRMFVDYAPCEKCTNPDAYGTICVKCGACGRKFDDKGVLIDNE